MPQYHVRRALCAFAMCFSVYFSFAQQFKVSFSDKMDENASNPNVIQVGSKIIFFNEIGSRDHLRYGFGWNKVRLGIEIVQRDTSGAGEKKVALSGGERVYGPIFTALRKINGQVYFIYHETQEKNTMGNVMAIRINPETLELDAPKVIANIAATDYKLEYSESLQNGLKFQLMPSPNKKNHLLVLHTQDKYFFTAVLDADLNIVWNKKQEFPEEGSYNFNDVTFDDAGSIYIAYRIHNSQSASSYTKDRITVRRATGKPLDLILNMQDEVSVIHIMVKPSAVKNIIHVGGFYKNRNIRWNLSGAFYTSLNTDNMKLGKVQKIAFPDTLVKQFARDGWGSKRKKRWGISSTLVPVLVEKPDGKVAIVAEMHTSEMGSKGWFYFSGDILYTAFEKTQAYFARIPKYRVSTVNSIGDSYHLFPFKDKMILFYNDHHMNLRKPMNVSPASSSEYNVSVLAAAIIDAKGQVSRQIVVDMSKDHYLALTEVMSDMAPDRLQVPMQQIGGLGGVRKGRVYANIEVQE
jgi:hypothetical protein